MTKFVTTTESIFDLDVECLVNPVNCVGVMGAGLAKEFKLRYPDLFESYKDWCWSSHIPVAGMCFVWTNNSVSDPVIIINVATKTHWKDQSKHEDIINGLINIKEIISDWGLCSIAVPKLGCGLGGLDWNKIRPSVEEILGEFDDKLTVYLYD